MNTKPIWKSKTIWLNVIGVADLIFNISGVDPVLKASILAALNAVLRIFFTDSEVTFKGGGAATVAGFLLAGTIFSGQMAMAQTGKSLWEPDYTVGLLTLKDKGDGGNGVEALIVPGIGLGVAYSWVSPSYDGTTWVTDWSVACDPLYFERDATGDLYWVPGVKGAAFNEYIQLYIGYKVGRLPEDVSRVEFKFGTSLTGIWDGLTAAIL